jgi:hypothetical protein
VVFGIIDFNLAYDAIIGILMLCRFLNAPSTATRAPSPKGAPKRGSK